MPAAPDAECERPGGWRPAVVNVASICGRWGIPCLPEHCASKHAFVGLTEALRGEFARFGIDVLLVLPGLVRSDDLNRHLLRNEGKIHLDFEGAQPPDEVADGVVRSLLRNRAEAAVGFVSWWVWFGKRLWPRGVRLFMRQKAGKWARASGRNPDEPPRKRWSECGRRSDANIKFADLRSLLKHLGFAERIAGVSLHLHPPAWWRF